MKIRSLIASAAAVASLATVGMAAASSAAVTTPAVTMAYHAPHQVNGPNKLSLVYNGTTYTYDVNLHSVWVAPGTKAVWGWLSDTFEPHQPAIFAVHGSQVGDVLTLTLNYPATGPNAGQQGERIFTLVINPVTHIASGHYFETGQEGANGAAFLVNPV